MDESGAPGIKTNDNDWLVVILVIFEGIESVNFVCKKIDGLRNELKLPVDYEFHKSSNSSRPQKYFIELIGTLDFDIIAVAIHKNDFKKTASYTNIATIIVNEILNNFPKINILMDSNPVLFKEMKSAIKSSKNMKIKIKQMRSQSHALLQVADYVASIIATKVKHPSIAKRRYSRVLNKIIKLILIDK